MPAHRLPAGCGVVVPANGRPASESTPPPSEWWKVFRTPRPASDRVMDHQPVLQRYLQAISEECDEHMGIGTVFELMINGPNAQFALQGSKHTLDLRQLHITG